MAVRSDPLGTSIAPREFAGTGRRWRGALKFSDASHYYLVTCVGGALGLLKAFAYARILGSQNFGYYALGVVFSSYWQIAAELGICRALECRLPLLYGAQRDVEGRQLRNHAAAQLAALGALFVPALALVCWRGGALMGTLDSDSRLVFLLAGVMSTATMFMGLVAVDLRSRGRIVPLGWLGLGRTLGNLTVGVGAAHAWGVPGLLVAETCVAAAMFVGFAWRGCDQFRFCFGDRGATRTLIRIGLPVAGRNLVNGLCRTLDRWIVSATIGIAAFGQYAFAMLIVSAADVLFASVWSHVGPAVSRRASRDGDLAGALVGLARQASILAGFAVLGYLPFVWVSAAVVERWFPQFAASGSLMAILYWGGAVELVSFFDWIPMAAQRTRPLFLSTAITASVAAIALAAAMHSHASATTFAWVFVGGRAIHLAGQLAAAAAVVRDGRSEPRNRTASPWDAYEPSGA